MRCDDLDFASRHDKQCSAVGLVMCTLFCGCLADGHIKCTVDPWLSDHPSFHFQFAVLL